MHCRTKLIAAAAALLFGVPVLAQLPLKRALPANTIAYVAVPNLPESIEEMQGMPLVKMWKETEVQDFFGDLIKLVEAKWDEGLDQVRAMHEKGMVPVDPDMLTNLRLNAAGFALTTLDIETLGDQTRPLIGAVAQLDFGDSAPAWRPLIEFLLQQLEQQGGEDLKREVTEIGEGDEKVELVTIALPETSMSINVAFIGNGVVAGTRRAEVESVVQSLLTEGGKGLTAAAPYQATFAPLDTKGAEAEMYLQPRPLVDFVLSVARVAASQGWAPIDVTGLERALDALGVNAIKGCGATTSYEKGAVGTKAVTRGFAYAPAPRKGVLGGMKQELDRGFLRWVPKDVTSFSATTFDANAVYDSIIAAVKAYDEKLAEQLLAALAHYEQQIGLDVRQDLVGALGNQVVWWSMPLAALGGMTPEMAILLQVRDQEKLLKSIRTLAQLSDGLVEIDESERQDITVYQLQINYDPTGGMGMNPLSSLIPTFSFKDGYLVAGFTSGDVKRAFSRMEREDDPSGDVRANAQFKPYLGQMPEKGINSLSFTDWKSQFEGMYQALTGILAFMPVGGDLPIDLSLLPEVATLTQHLFGEVSWAVADEKGIHFHSESPWGPEVVVPVAAAVIGGVATLGVTQRLQPR